MRKLIILAISFLLYFPAMLLAKPPEDRIKERDIVGVKTEVYYQKAKDAGVVEEVSGVVKIKPVDWKDVKIKDRIDLRILDEVGTETAQAGKIADKTEDDTTLRVKVAVIVGKELENEVLANAQELIKPTIANAQELISNFLEIKQQELLSAASLVQFPLVQFPFVEEVTVSSSDWSSLPENGKDVYFINVDSFIWESSTWGFGRNVYETQKTLEDLKLGNYKVVSLVSNWYQNCSIIELGGKISDFAAIAEKIERAYLRVKEVNPEVAVGFPCVMFPEMESWLSSFTIKPDVWMLYNVAVFGANWGKVKVRWFKDRPVMVNLNHHHAYHDYGGQEYGSAKYQDCVKTLKELGYAGSIYWKPN